MVKKSEEVTEEVLGGREISEVVALVRERGGATLDPRTGEEPRSGYVVNEAGGCPTLDRDDFYGPSAREMVRELLSENATFYTGKHLGIWEDEENSRITFDRVDVIRERSEAIRIGEERGALPLGRRARRGDHPLLRTGVRTFHGRDGTLRACGETRERSVSPRYRDVVWRTWEANRHSCGVQLKGGMVLACLAGSLTLVGTNIFEPRSAPVVLPGLCALLLVTGCVVLGIAAQMYGELAGTSLVVTGEVTGSYFVGPTRPRWETIMVCWKLLHVHEDVREVFAGITQDLKVPPRLHHLKSARFLTTS